MFLGAQKFGGKKSRRKACLSLEGERYQYQRFISYLVGVDPAAHFNQPEEALGVEALCLELGNKDGLAYRYWNWGLLAREQRDRNTEREKLTAALKFSPI